MVQLHGYCTTVDKKMRMHALRNATLAGMSIIHACSNVENFCCYVHGWGVPQYTVLS